MTLPPGLAPVYRETRTRTSADFLPGTRPGIPGSGSFVGSGQTICVGGIN
jgi:hypothetical protein